MKKNQILIVNTEEAAFPNKSVATVEGVRITIKDALPQQKLEIHVTKLKENKAEAKLLKIIEHSPIEEDSGCQHFGICGGCCYQHISFQNETALKKSQIEYIFKEANIKIPTDQLKISSIDHYGYRNKVELAFGDTGLGSQLSLGMRKKNSFYEVVTITDCNIVHNDFVKILLLVREFYEEKGITFYHRIKHDGLLRHLVIRKAFFTNEILINLVTASGGNELLCLEELTSKLSTLKLDGKLSGIVHTANDCVADAVKNEVSNTIWGRNYIQEKLLGLDFRITTFSFFQTNSKGAEQLYTIVLNYISAALGNNFKQKIIFDLYSGTGTIAQLVAKSCKTVYAIEIVDEAVNAAKENAILNQIDNINFQVGDVLKLVDDIPEPADLIVIDPPREGINPKALAKIIKKQTPYVVYVSCNPVTLVRDLQVLLQSGYEIVKMESLDMFRRTGHCESVVLMQCVDLVQGEKA